MQLLISKQEKLAMGSLTIIKLKFIFGVALLSLIGGSVKSQDSDGRNLTDTAVVIPPEFKISLQGRRPVPVAERAFLLSDLHVNEAVEIFQAPPCLDGKYYVAIQLYYDLGDRNTVNDWVAQLDLTLRQEDQKFWTKSLHVDMIHQTFISTVFHEQPISCDQNYEIVLNDIRILSRAPKENIYLKFYLYRYDEQAFDPEAKLTLSADYANHQSALTWSYEGTRVLDYEIEWAFIDEYDAFTSNKADDAFLFARPVRISSPSVVYIQSVNYPTGKLWYRARAIGYNPDAPEHRIPGKWFYAANPIKVEDTQSLNWRRSTKFSEEGQHKNEISYFDGTLRERQIQSLASSQSQYVVTTTMYDFEGRPSLRTLPAPIGHTNLQFVSGLNSFVSRDDVVASQTTDARIKSHFDNGELKNSVLSTKQGAGNYYSPENNKLSFHKDYIPTSGGYAYSQNEYSSDGYDFKVKESISGEAFQIDGEHVVRDFRGAVAPEELIRLFGNYAYQATSFKKYLTVDVNGQASVQYRDRQNRVVATALAGSDPAGLAPLASFTNLSSEPLTVAITDRNVITEGLSRTQHSLLNVSPNTPYSFRYDVSAYALSLGDQGCQDCVFDLQIDIVDPHGRAVNLSDVAGNESTEGVGYKRKNLKASDCLASSVLSTVKFDVQLAEIGDYMVIKSLQPHIITYPELENLLSQNPKIQKEINQLKDNCASASSPCVLCVPSSTESSAGINEAIQEATDLESNNVYQEIIQHYKTKHGLAYTVSEDSIGNHPLYCQYQLLLKNRESSLFEKQIAQITDWNEAVEKGYAKLLDVDPFFNNSAMSGFRSKEVMRKELDNIQVAVLNVDSNKDGITDTSIEYEGKLEEITDPSNTNYFIKPDGSLSAQNGFHLLYAGLMGVKNQLSVAGYEQEVSKLRWILFRSYYMSAKSKVAMSIQEYQNCPVAMQTLKQDSLATPPVDEMQAIVNDAELDMIMSEVEFVCNKAFSKTDSTAIRDAFKIYFNNTPGNFLRAVVRADISSDNNLKTIQSILNGYGCGLDAIAQDGPLMCLKDVMPQTPLVQDLPAQRVATVDETSAVDQDTIKSSIGATQTGSNPVNPPPLTTANTEASSRKVQDNPQGVALPALHNSNQHEDKVAYANEDGNTSALPNRAEYNALIALYTSLGGEEWKHKEGWGKTDSKKLQNVSSWDGVTTDAAGHVIILNLESNNLRGEMPKEIGDLAYLQFLSFGAVNKTNVNSLRGVIPATIGNLQALRHLDLSYNQLTGAIPVELFKLKSLQYLDLSVNALNGSLVSEVGNLVNLSVLNLRHNEISRTLPTGLGKLAGLVQLYLSDNKFYGSIPSSLGNLSKLQHLDLSNNGFNGTIPATTGNLAELRYARLNNNFLNNSIPAEIGNLANLKQLDLSVNRLSGSIPESIGNLLNLQHIVLSGNQLEGNLPTSLGKLNALLSLSFKGNHLSGTIPDQLFSLVKLQYLDISMNELTGPLSESIDNAKALQKLFLSDNQLNGSIPPSVGSLPELTEISLDRNQFDGSLPVSIGNLTKLESLHLAGNKLIGKIPKNISHLTELQNLVLSNNQFSDSIPSEIGNLSHLKKLDMSNNKLVGPIPGELGQLANLSELTLDDNKLTGTIPASLGNLKYLTRVVLLNNDLKGTIFMPAGNGQTSQDEALWLSHNKFTFENLQPLAGTLNKASFFFSNQDSVDVEKVVPATIGSPVTLTASIDRSVTPACSYQWFKYVDGVNDSILNAVSTDGHSYTLANLRPSSPSAQYYYKITNTQIPSLTLVSNMQTVMAFRSHDLCSAYQVTSEGISSFKLDVSWNAELEKCKKRMIKQDSLLKTFMTERFVEKEAVKLFKKYQSNCINRVKETFEYTFIPTEYYYTLYFYDQSGNKIQVVEPQEVRVLSATEVNSVKNGNSVKRDYKFATKYAYNSFGKPVVKYKPVGHELYWYNSVGQLRATQTSQQDLDSKYTYYRYNPSGRMVEKGEMSSKKNAKTIAVLVEETSFPLANQFSLDNISNTYFGNAIPLANPSVAQENIQNRISRQKTVSGVDTVQTYYSYDVAGNTKAVLQQTPGLENKSIVYLYDQSSGQLNNIFYQYGKKDQFLQYYTYNDDQSLKSVSSSTDGFIWNQEARYYYYAHGPIARVELGAYRVQGLDYHHTLQGWNKGLNILSAGEGSDGTNSGRDVFSYTVGYFKDDYRPIKSSLTLPEHKSNTWTQYNANYQTAGSYNGLASWTISGSLENSTTAFYQYDQLGRTIQVKGSPETGDENFIWNESFGLQSAAQKGKSKTENTTFSYSPESPRATGINGSSLKYDASGKLIEDEAAALKISWTMDGQVKKVEQGDSVKVYYTYDGRSNCVQREIEKNKMSFKTSYIHGLELSPVAIYDKDEVELLLFGTERLGQYTGQTDAGTQMLGNRQYELKDHNQNVRIVITDKVGLNQSSAWATQTAVYNYYLGGSTKPHDEKKGSSQYRYGFMSMERESVSPSYYFNKGQLYNIGHLDILTAGSNK